MKDLIITGIPRSGTTLATALVDGLDDSIALSEPPWHNETFARAKSKEEYVDYIQSEFQRLRQAIQRGEAILDRRNSNGFPVTNYFKRQAQHIQRNFELLHIRKNGLSEEFLLAIKHNENFACILPELLALKQFDIMVVIRNPLSTILSWCSMKKHKDFLPIAAGEMPSGEKFWPAVRAINADSSLTLEQRMVCLYDCFCDRFIQCQSGLTLFRYEDIIKHPETIAHFCNRSQKYIPEIQNRNNNAAYPFEESEKIIAALKSHGRALKKFYDIDSIVAPI